MLFLNAVFPINLGKQVSWGQQLHSIPVIKQRQMSNYNSVHPRELMIQRAGTFARKHSSTSSMRKSASTPAHSFFKEEKRSITTLFLMIVKRPSHCKGEFCLLSTVSYPTVALDPVMLNRKLCPTHLRVVLVPISPKWFRASSLMLIPSV